MVSGHHLWKVDQYGFLIVVNHDVKLVEIAVNDTIIRQFHKQVH